MLGYVWSYLSSLWQQSNDCWSEFDQEGWWLFVDRARSAELLWLFAYLILFVELVFLLVRNRPSGTSLHQISQQSLSLYVFVSIYKAIFPQGWRFHELCWLDKYTATVGSMALGLLVFILGWEPHGNLIGAESFQRTFPTFSRKYPKLLRPIIFYSFHVIVLLIAIPIDIFARPSALQVEDRRGGVWPLLGLRTETETKT